MCEGANVKLWNGVEMPRVGLGTAGRMGEKTVTTAIEAGVRLFDTARAREWYDEDGVAYAVARSKGRKEYFIVSKLHPSDHGYESCLKAVQDSAAKFGGVIDGFLLHYPVCWDGLCGSGWEGKVEGSWRDSWRALESAYRKGIVRAIGVSNFRVDEMRHLLSFASIQPHLVQNWMDPFHQDRAVRRLCGQNSIVYMSYSTLGTQWRQSSNPVAVSPILAQIAADFDDATSQSIALAWAMQRGAVVVPRSFKEKHIHANANLFITNLQQGVNKNQEDTMHILKHCLSSTQLALIDNLDTSSTHDEDSSSAATVTAVFTSDVPANLFWLAEDNSRHLVASIIGITDSFSSSEDKHEQKRRATITTYKGHRFLALPLHGSEEQENATTFTVTAAPGSVQKFHLRADHDDAEEEL